MDKIEEDVPLIGTMLHINNVEPCEKNTSSNNNETKEELVAMIIQHTLFYQRDQKKLNYAEMKKDFETTADKYLDLYPKLLRDTIISSCFPGDNGRSITERPDWFDMEKFKKGQTFARDHFAGVFMAQLCGLMCMICHEDGLKTLIMTKKSHTPYLAFKRYLSTAERVRNWFTEDPWCEGTKANKDIQAVRRMHLAARRKLCKLNYDEFDAIGTIKNPYCPAFPVIQKDFCTSLCPNSMEYIWYSQYTDVAKPKSLNQMDMSFTLFGFMGLVVLFPNEFGIYVENDKDLENFCHVWRCIGYLLGIEDDINFCRGSLENVKKRCREYIEFLVKPAFQRINSQWEHMSRCIFKGFSYWFFIPGFEETIVGIAELLNIEISGLYASLTYWQRIKFHLGKYVFRYALKFAILREFMNKVLNRTLDKTIRLDEAQQAKIKKKSMKSKLHVAHPTEECNKVNTIIL